MPIKTLKDLKTACDDDTRWDAQFDDLLSQKGVTEDSLLTNVNGLQETLPVLHIAFAYALYTNDEILERATLITIYNHFSRLTRIIDIYYFGVGDRGEAAGECLHQKLDELWEILKDDAVGESPKMVFQGDPLYDNMAFHITNHIRAFLDGLRSLEIYIRLGYDHDEDTMSFAEVFFDTKEFFSLIDYLTETLYSVALNPKVAAYRVNEARNALFCDLLVNISDEHLMILKTPPALKDYPEPDDKDLENYYRRAVSIPYTTYEQEQNSRTGPTYPHDKWIKSLAALANL